MEDLRQKLLKGVMRAAMDDAAKYYTEHRRVAQEDTDTWIMDAWATFKKEAYQVSRGTIHPESYAGLYEVYKAAYVFFTEELARNENRPRS